MEGLAYDTLYGLGWPFALWEAARGTYRTLVTGWGFLGEILEASDGL